jgi:predicted PurR-regulated permease PerM
MTNHTEEHPNSLLNNNGWGNKGQIRTLVLLLITGLGIYLCFRLAVPFLPAIAWALALAVLLVPFHRRLESRIQRPNVAAVISVVVAGLIIVVPVTILGQQLVQQAANGAQVIKEKTEANEWRHVLDSQPRLKPVADWIERKIDVTGTINTITNWVTTAAGSLVKASVIQIIGFFLTFYLLFFFLRDRQIILQSLRSLAPLPEAEMDQMIARVDDTIYATVYGTLTVSMLQGLLGGLMFWWLGLPAPLLWGLVMALLALVPVLGTFVVWSPAALFLALNGNWGKAIILTTWGLTVVASIDNLLQPLLVGNRLRMHTLLVFMSIVGGLVLFGAAGLILGPVALTLTLGLLEAWQRRTPTAAPKRVAPQDLDRMENEGGPPVATLDSAVETQPDSAYAVTQGRLS